MVLICHGTGGTAAWTVSETNWTEYAAQARFLAVFPDALPVNPERGSSFLANPQHWNEAPGRTFPGETPVDDVAFIDALLDDLARHFPIDPRRVFATGFSNGAGFVFRLGAELSHRLAAIAPVAGYCWLEEPHPRRPLPTLYTVGTADPLIPFDGGEVRTPWGQTEVRPPIPVMLSHWARAIGCAPEPRPLGDRDGVRRTVYPGKGEMEVVCCAVEGLGHHWPGGRGMLSEGVAGPHHNHFDATAAIWEFFTRHNLISTNQ